MIMTVRRLSLCWIFLIASTFLIRDTGGAFPGIFPLLTTGWYFKPGPVESLILGMIVVKVLAVRLTATMAGVPYHLNDIFDTGKLLQVSSLANRTRRHLDMPTKDFQPKVLSSDEIKVLERILLALRRIDSHDCFIRYLCQVHQEYKNSDKIRNITPVDVDTAWFILFRLRPLSASNNTGQSSVWNLYEEALNPVGLKCSKKYSNCPLSTSELKNFSSNTFLSGII